MPAKTELKELLQGFGKETEVEQPPWEFSKGFFIGSFFFLDKRSQKVVF